MNAAQSRVRRKQNVAFDTHFRIEPCSTCRIAGYLIVSPRVPVSSLAALSPGAQISLGPTLTAATRAIEAVIHPERVYCLLFAEETRTVHFHLFPRTKRLLAEYRRVHPTETKVSGPTLLHWVRATFREPPTKDYEETNEAIFHSLRQNA
jgi:diadenosine tetraphosphate (Ap4A) HIT family hydrolase